VALNAPPLPLPCASCHTFSNAMLAPASVDTNVVPPQAMTLGLDAGKSAKAGRPGALGPTEFPDPWSPDAAKTLTFLDTALCKMEFMRCRAVDGQYLSGAPQEMDTIVALAHAACTASQNPVKEFGANTTSSVASGAIAPATCMSRATSMLLAWSLGLFVARPRNRVRTLGTGRPRAPKYCRRSEAVKPPPNCTRAMVCPAPVPGGNPYMAPTCTAVKDRAAAGTGARDSVLASSSWTSSCLQYVRSMACPLSSFLWVGTEKTSCRLPKTDARNT
jgi:hypothetical protein